MQLEKIYEPGRFEPRWAEWWIERGFFRAEAGAPGPRPTFSLVIPPPNVTGSLHIGHMLEHTEIDVTVRWHRMNGRRTLWLPGTDHAGIATQMVVERSLREKEGLSRHDLGREEFEKRVWQWKEQYGGAILAQMRRMGDSCDWSRNRFTLDEGLSRAVRETFVTLYEKGLIYRGDYMVNWCPQCHTALSDLEVDHEEAEGNLWHIRYPVKDRPGHFLTVATTRPETMLGDTAVCVNPSDERYAGLEGASVVLPLLGRVIPVIHDELADPAFGTGVVKVTPAHDPNDFEAGRRHNLPHVKVIDKDAKMTAAAGPYQGLDRYEARKRVLADLERHGLLDKTTAYTLSAGKCQRCRTVVEPLVSTQWFCRMKPLAEPAIKAVADGSIRFVPESWTKTYNEWMHNIRDWCVSRQLWWGHRIPAWHCGDCGKPTVARMTPQSCSHCGSAKLTQDPDVLDTWFSSGLWPFSTLGWPDQTEDLKTFYPTTLLITGFDILFFWVARMVMLGIEMMGDVPFRTVYIHGLVRDADRQKMSKTKGNTVDPLVVTRQYGTDAVRFALLRGAAPGTDIVLSEERMVSSRAFANKIWNAARFIFMQMEKAGVESFELAASAPVEALEDRWIFHRLNETTAKINAAQENFRYHEVADLIWGFLWDEFCDWYVEIKKLRIHAGVDAHAHLTNLLRVFEQALRLLHPVMPFLTEELWQRLVKRDASVPESISIAAFPQARADWESEEGARGFALIQQLVTEARALRAERKLDPKQRLEGAIRPGNEAVAGLVRSELPVIEALTNTQFELVREVTGAVRSRTDFDVALRLSAAQAGAERQRLARDVEALRKAVESKRKQLASESFIGRAPEAVVLETRAKLAEQEAQLALDEERLRELGD